MDDHQQIRLDCLHLAMARADGWTAANVISDAEDMAAFVIGAQAPLDTDADAEVLITVARPEGYLINKDLGGWYFTAPGAYGSPSTHWATEAEAIAHAQTHKAMASAWEPEDPQMGELEHPKPTIAEVADRLDQADIDFDMRVAAAVRRLISL